ncbi:MAG TPA: VOC family protein [Noviherbaspirillum sp.]|nr:VOC family protein [Noviherbaspirillum sp.]
MADDNPSIISHVSIGTNDFAAAVRFYDSVLAALDIRRVMDHPGAAAYGKRFPEFWVQTPIDGYPASVGNGTHVSFVAASKQAVDAFYQAALEAGATDSGAPGPRPMYGDPYYGCFVRDPDGHKIEATFWDSGGAAV